MAFRKEIASAEDPVAKRREIEERLAKGRTPFPQAESFAIHELIDPRKTRAYLYDWIDCCQTLLEGLRGRVTFPIRP